WAMVEYRLPETLQWQKHGWERAVRRRDLAIACFFDLGEGGAPAIPELMRLINCTNSPAVSAAAMHALACTGQPGLPRLLAVMEDTNRQDRAQAANWVGNFADHYGSNGVVAIPALVRCLQDKDRNVACESAVALARLYVDPTFVLPPLSEGLAST